MQRSVLPAERGRSQAPLPDEDRYEGGSLSVWVSVVILALSLTTAAVHQAVEAGSRPAEALQRRVEERIRLEAVADEVEIALRSDATPEADSYHDRVWSLLESLRAAGRSAELSDISSDGGPYAYVNVNTAPLTQVDSLLAAADIPAPRRDTVLSELVRRRRTGRAVSRNLLESLLGLDCQAIHPMLCTEAVVNVNFAGRQTLSRAVRTCREAYDEIASRYGTGPAEAHSENEGSPADGALDRLLDRVLSERVRLEIDPTLLGTLLTGLPSRDPVRLAIGVKTRCWRISVESGNLRLVRLLAAVPAPGRNEFRTVGAYQESLVGTLPPPGRPAP